MRKDPYNRILSAAKNGAGVNLNAEETRALASDGAIADRACFISENPYAWKNQVAASRPTPRYFGPKD